MAEADGDLVIAAAVAAPAVNVIEEVLVKFTPESFGVIVTEPEVVPDV